MFSGRKEGPSGVILDEPTSFFSYSNVNKMHWGADWF